METWQEELSVGHRLGINGLDSDDQTSFKLEIKSLSNPKKTKQTKLFPLLKTTWEAEGFKER